MKLQSSHDHLVEVLLSIYSYGLFLRFSPSPTGAIADRLNLLHY